MKFQAVASVLCCAVWNSSSIFTSAFSLAPVSRTTIATAKSVSTTALGMVQQRGLEVRQEGATPMGEYIHHTILMIHIHIVLLYNMETSNSSVSTRLVNVPACLCSFVASSRASSVETSLGSVRCYCIQTPTITVFVSYRPCTDTWHVTVYCIVLYGTNHFHDDSFPFLFYFLLSLQQHNNIYYHTTTNII
jgi:hypothetical protein